MTDRLARRQLPDAATRERLRHERDRLTRERERMDEQDTKGRTLGRSQLERRYTALDRADRRDVHVTGNLETRLRARIDVLTDQRDRALHLAEARRVNLDRYRRRLSAARASRDRWRALYRGTAAARSLAARWKAAA